MMCLENSAQIFNALSDIPGDVEDVEQLLEVGTSQCLESTNFNVFLCVDFF
jgi:hypothetical protein